MDKQIKKIYDLLHSPIVTPYNLLENAKLPNYSYVNYYEGAEGLIAEMKCFMEDRQEEVIFYYHFDEEDKLNRIYQKSVGDSKKKMVYDREKELDRAKKVYKNEKCKEKGQVS